MRALESQALDSTHKLMAVEDARRKLQVLTDQLKSEIEYLTKGNAEVREANRVQMDSMQADFNYQIKSMRNMH